MARKILADEVEHVAQALLEKGFQGVEDKRGLCLHLARIAVNAHHEWGDEEQWQQARAAVQAEMVKANPALMDDFRIDPPEEFLTAGELAHQFPDLIAGPSKRNT